MSDRPPYEKSVMTRRPSLMRWSLVLTLCLVSGWGFVTQAESAERQTPLIVAHRGLLQHAPENTLAAFRACLELRIGFEFDVARTRDGQLICIHDDRLDRTTNGRGAVSEMTLEQIRTLDAGSWFDPVFNDQKVPTVDEVLRLLAEYRNSPVLVAVDLKIPNAEASIVRLAEQHNIVHKLLFIGQAISDPNIRQRLKTASANVQSAAVANAPTPFLSALKADHANWVYFRYIPTEEEMNAVRNSGKRSFIAGVTVSGNLPENWRKVAETGVSAILTDHPLKLRAMLRKNLSARE